MKDRYLLVIDSSGATLAVCVMKNNEVLASFNENTGLTHSCTLIPKIIEMIEKSNISLDDIDYYVCSNGPGSFTGLRIGISAMKGLAHAKNKKMVAVSTLDGLMHNIEEFDGLICPIIDARRKEVYTALYYNGEKILDDCGISLDELFEIIKEKGAKKKKVIFCGDGVISYKDYIKENLGELCFFADEEKCLQNAVSVGKAALKKIEKGEVLHYSEFSASYLKPSQPERQQNITV